MPEITVTDVVDRREWRAFADRMPDGNIFHLPEFGEVLTHARSHSPVLLAARTRSEIVGLMLAAEVRMLQGWLGRFGGRSVLYGGLLCDRTHPEAIVAAQSLIKAFASRPPSLFSEIRNLTESSFLFPVLSECGYERDDHLNYLVSLQGGADQVWSRISKNGRKTLRNGQNRGIVIEEVADRQGVDECYRLFKTTYSRVRVPLPDVSLFHAALSVLDRRGMIKFLLARYRDTPVAASVELIYKDRIYGWYQGSDRNFGSLPANDLLIWHILKWGAENGYTTYDFGGAGRPGQRYGVRDFKSKFGGELVNYGRFICPHYRRLYGLARSAYSNFQKLSNSNGTGRMAAWVDALKNRVVPRPATPRQDDRANTAGVGGESNA